MREQLTRKDVEKIEQEIEPVSYTHLEKTDIIQKVQ